MNSQGDEWRKENGEEGKEKPSSRPRPKRGDAQQNQPGKRQPRKLVAEFLPWFQQDLEENDEQRNIHYFFQFSCELLKLAEYEKTEVNVGVSSFSEIPFN